VAKDKTQYERGMGKERVKKCASKIYDAIMQVLPSPTAAATAADAATITARLPP
jgi:hypothetical protein